MFEKLRQIFQVPELRRRILFTLALFTVYRLGEHITTPGVNAQALTAAFNQGQANTLFGLYDMFSGRAFSRATIFALGIMPYISASIILQLLGSVYPPLEKLQKEGEAGRKKINEWTRYATVVLCFFQSYAYIYFSVASDAGESGVILPAFDSSYIRFCCVITMTAGSILLMWIGEQID